MITSVENLIFNGVDLSDTFSEEENGTYLIVNSVYGRGFTQADNTLIRVTGMDGAHPSYSRIPVRELVVTLTLKGKSFEDLRKRIEVLNGILYTNGKDVPMNFADEPDRTYYGRLDAVTDVVEVSHIYKAELTFICADPYKYAPERILTFPEDVDTAIVDNKGEATVYPTIELTATKKTTFAMVSNGGDEDSEYNLIGRPADVDETVVDEKTLLFDETGDTLSDWDTPSDFQGDFKAESNGIFVDSYGTGSDWHGPARIREIDPTEDFEIEFFTSVRTERPEMTFRLSTNFFDENMNELGLLRVWNKTNTRIRKIIEARIGPYTGTNFENYLISSDNYLWENQRVYNGIVRVTRKGSEYTFYAAHITQRGNHIETITQRYNDVNNEYAGKLKFIRFDAAIYGSNPTPNELSITRVRAYRHNKVLVDQTPYIVQPGDVVTFDHKMEEVLINGEPRMDLKNFGGSFFALEKGDNMLLITPEDSFETRVSMQERYL